MDHEDMPSFDNVEDELAYWRQKALHYKDKSNEIQQELLDYQENSLQLEKELEKSLELSERTNRDLINKVSRLTLELEMCREQCLQSNKQILDLEKEISDLRQREEKLLKYSRDLEQKNDDLERSERVMIESLGNIEAKLNCAIERNALLENELVEKEVLVEMVQRLKDEQRDMQEELRVQKQHSIPDNDRYMESHPKPIKINPNVGQLSPTNRISTINLVGDLLKKVGSLESKFPASKASRDNKNDSPVRQSYRTRNQRINRGTSSPTLQNNYVKM